MNWISKAEKPTGGPRGQELQQKDDQSVRLWLGGAAYWESISLQSEGVLETLAKITPPKFVSDPGLKLCGPFKPCVTTTDELNSEHWRTCDICCRPTATLWWDSGGTWMHKETFLILVWDFFSLNYLVLLLVIYDLYVSTCTASFFRRFRCLNCSAGTPQRILLKFCLTIV